MQTSWPQRPETLDKLDSVEAVLPKILSNIKTTAQQNILSKDLTNGVAYAGFGNTDIIRVKLLGLQF